MIFSLIRLYLQSVVFFENYWLIESIISLRMFNLHVIKYLKCLNRSNFELVLKNINYIDKLVKWGKKSQCLFLECWDFLPFLLFFYFLKLCSNLTQTSARTCSMIFWVLKLKLYCICIPQELISPMDLNEINCIYLNFIFVGAWIPVWRIGR